MTTINQTTYEAPKVEKEVVQQAAAAKRGPGIAQAKDIVVSFEGGETEKKAEKKKKGPALPPPAARSGKSDLGSKESMSIIAIISEVLALQAKENSEFWSISWKTASKAMTSEVTLAKVTGEAVKESADQQSQATENEAKQAMAEGVAMAIASGLMLFMGGVGEFKDPTGGASKETGLTNETETAENTAKDTEENLIKTENEPTENLESSNNNNNAKTEEIKSNEKTTKELEKTKENAQEGRAKKVWNGLKKFKGSFDKFSGRVYGAYGKAMNAAMGIQMMTTATNNIAFVNQYKTAISKNQKNAGEADALAKTAEQYSQYYSQSFSRNEDLRQSSQQNIDYAMNILKGTSDSITQAVNTMFQG